MIQIHPPSLFDSKSSSSRYVATREALLDAAEHLFVKCGVAETSTRDIIKAAGANLGAINYHFGTKERLVLEVFSRRLRPLHEEMIARLDALEEKCLSERAEPKLEQIIEALIGPIVEIHENQPEHASLLRLICLEVRENSATKDFVEAERAEVAKRFDTAILRAVPALPPGEFLWRMKFLCGALHCGIEMWTGVDKISWGGDIQPLRLDRAGFIQRYVAFVSAGLSAPIPKDELVS